MALILIKKKINFHKRVEPFRYIVDYEIYLYLFPSKKASVINYPELQRLTTILLSC